MTPENNGHVRDADSTARELARAQRVREVNGELVLSSLRAHEATDAAEATTRELKASEEQLRTFADTLPILAWYANPDGHIPWYNRRWYDYTGTTLDEQEGWKWKSVHDPDDLPRVVAGWKHALASGEPWADEFRLRRHDGQFRWFLSRAVPLRDADGQIVRWFGTNMDVDDQKRAEAAIRGQAEAERKRLQMMFDESPTAACVLRGPDLRIELVNPMILDMWGKSDAILGQPLMAALPELHGQGFDDLLRGVLKTGVAYHGKEVLARLDRNRDGVLQDTYFDFVYAPLRGADGSIEGVFIHAYDVTEKVDARRDVEASRVEADRLLTAELATAELRERLLGILGHDLRNPLSAVTMGAGILVAHGNLTEEDKRVVMRVLSGARRMDRMIMQILDFTRARLGGGMLFELRPTDLGEVCRNATEELTLGASVPVQCTTHGDMMGRWDADRLAEVISNIAGNAAEHARVGTGVALHAYGDGSEVVVEISNEGDPIPADVLPFIFEPFRRARQSEHSKAGNLGLGLYIASEITRAHRGTLVARSAEGRTTFTMRLPRSPPPLASSSESGNGR